MRYRIVVEELPALFDSRRRLRRVAAVTDGETISVAFEHTDETWSVAAGQLVEDSTGILDPRPLVAGSEKTARQWVELVARLYLKAQASRRE